jgi:thymus-specific serine protease
MACFLAWLQCRTFTTWNQRFWVNSTFWKGPQSNAPVFLYIEGEGAGSPLDVVSGQHVELAATHGALIIALEHRFFGASVPTKDLTVNSLRYLSSQQAIADTARFITSYIVPTFNVNIPPEGHPEMGNPIVTFGGSYPGALSAFLRLSLPHLIAFAFSTSSPIQAEYDFNGYCQVVSAALANPLVGGSQECLNAVTTAFQTIDQALRGNSAQQASIAKQLGSCEAPQSIDDVKLLASNAAGVFMGIVQYNMDTGVPGPTVASACQTMLAASDPVSAVAQIWAQTAPGQNCSDNSYQDFITTQVGNTTADPTATGVGIRQWTWMTCIEYSYFQTCEEGCPFSSLMDEASQVKICQDAFDQRMDAAFVADRVAFTNSYFGGYNLTTTNILYTNGGIDPWHYLSITPSNINPNGPQYDSWAVWIPDGAHCSNMFPSSPNDRPDITKAKAESASILAQFLAGGSNNTNNKA